MDLGCATELIRVRELSERTGAERQLDLARRADRLAGLVAELADEFSSISRLGEAGPQASRSSAGTTSPAGDRSNA